MVIVAYNECFPLDVHSYFAQALSIIFWNARTSVRRFFLLVRNLRRLLPLSPPRGRGGGFSESREEKRIAFSS